MKPRVLCCGVIALMTAGCAVQQSPIARQRLQDAMTSDLRTFASAQDIYFSERNTYADDLHDLPVRTTGDVVIELTDASQSGWAAIAYHKATPKDFCAIFVGKPAGIPAPASREGVPACGVRLGENPEVRVERFMRVLRKDLRNLAVQQEAYYADPRNNYAYAPSISALPKFRPSEGVTLMTTTAGQTGWAAVATHAALPLYQRCALFVGTVGTVPKPATSPGIVACAK